MLSPASLAEWREREGVGLEQLARTLRIEAAMLERIEAAEVEPDDDLVERIGDLIERGFNHGFGLPGPTANPPATQPAAAGDVPSPRRGGRGAAAPNPAAPPAAAPPTFMAWLARRDGGGWFIESWWEGWRYQVFSIDKARKLVAELGELVAIHDAGGRMPL